MRKTHGAGTTGGMIPGTPIAHGKKTSVELSSTGLTHGRGQIGMIKHKTVISQAIDVRSEGIFSAVEPQIAAGAVIGQDHQHVGSGVFAQGEHLPHCQKERDPQPAQLMHSMHGVVIMSFEHDAVNAKACHMPCIHRASLHERELCDP